MSRKSLKRKEKETKEQESLSFQSESESEDSFQASFNFNLLKEEFSQGESDVEQIISEEGKSFKKKKIKKSKELQILKPICQTKKPTMAELINSIIKIDAKKLNLENEFQKLFKTTATKRGVDKPRRDIFGKPNREWVKISKLVGLQMEKRGGNNFVFVYDKLHRMAEKIFMDGFTSENTTMISNITKICPVHITSLLFHSEIALNVDQDFDKSFELLKLILYIYKSKFDVFFNITSPVNFNGEIRFMDFQEYGNVAFYYSLNMYMHVAIRKNCYKTALEVAKVIFSLDPFKDPLGILLIIDCVSLRAKEYKFLINFYTHFTEIKKLDLMPNFAYSVSIAKYYAEGEESGISAMCCAIRRFSIVISWLPGVNLFSRMKIGCPFVVELAEFYSLINESLFTRPSSLGSVVVKAAIRRMRDEDNFDLDSLARNSNALVLSSRYCSRRLLGIDENDFFENFATDLMKRFAQIM